MYSRIQTLFIYPWFIRFYRMNRQLLNWDQATTRARFCVILIFQTNGSLTSAEYNIIIIII